MIKIRYLTYFVFSSMFLQYFLVQENAGSGGNVNLPTPDASGTISMSATAGKVVLANINTAVGR